MEEYGPYMNKRWAVYDNTGTMEVWFSDRVRALEWWSNNCDRETWAEQRERQRRERAILMAALPDIEEFEELPFY